MSGCVKEKGAFMRCFRCSLKPPVVGPLWHRHFSPDELTCAYRVASCRVDLVVVPCPVTFIAGQSLTFWSWTLKEWCVSALVEMFRGAVETVVCWAPLALWENPLRDINGYIGMNRYHACSELKEPLEWGEKSMTWFSVVHLSPDKKL